MYTVFIYNALNALSKEQNPKKYGEGYRVTVSKQISK